MDASYSSLRDELLPVPGLAARWVRASSIVVLQYGCTLTMNGLFTQPRTLMSSPIAEQLGCALEDGSMGRFIKVDEGKATNVSACGDGRARQAMSRWRWRMGRWRGFGRIGGR